jgi:hypothetical protein
MTQQPHPDRYDGRDPDRHGRDPDPPSDPLALSELIAAGDIDVVPGDPPVPIAVWRVADVDARHGHQRADELTPRLAALLVGAHTHPGDTIISIGDDPALAGAAGAGGRRYRALARADQLADLDHTAGTVALIVLPWPPDRDGAPWGKPRPRKCRGRRVDNPTQRHRRYPCRLARPPRPKPRRDPPSSYPSMTPCSGWPSSRC